MGLTLCSIHILSTEIPQIPGVDFQSFSKGWFTCTNLDSFEEDYKLARKISKNTDKPVLYFYVYDSEIVSFAFLISGRKIVDFSTDSSFIPKGISKIPEIIGDAQKGSKKKISLILQCSDDERLISLLEEYFGLNLLFDAEYLSESADIKVEKGDRLYLEYLEDYKKICGKGAPIRAELVKEYHGKVFDHLFLSEGYCPEYYYLFGYDAPDHCELRPVFFSGSELVPCVLKPEDYVSQRRMRPAWVSLEYDGESDSYYYKFASDAPAGFAGSEIACPKGYYFLSIDNRNHIILTDYKHSLIFMDCTGNVVSRCSVKGDPIAFRDGFILTEGPGSEWAFEYSPTDYVRIYRLLYKT